MLLAVVGMMFTAAATDLFVLFLAFETSSLSTFALVAFRKRDKQATEAAVKFFIIGAVSSGIILFGISLIYGIAGTTSIGKTTTDLLLLRNGLTLAGHPEIEPPLIIALVLLIAGFGFKVAVVPFHMWAPDVYQGSPTTISVLLTSASKNVGIVPRRRRHRVPRDPGRHRGLQRAEPAHAVHGLLDARLPPQPRGHPAAWRVLFEVCLVLERGERSRVQPMVLGARRCRRLEQRPLPLLLRAGDLVHVHPRAGGRYREGGGPSVDRGGRLRRAGDCHADRDSRRVLPRIPVGRSPPVLPLLSEGQDRFAPASPPKAFISHPDHEEPNALSLVGFPGRQPWGTEPLLLSPGV